MCMICFAYDQVYEPVPLRTGSFYIPILGFYGLRITPVYGEVCSKNRHHLWTQENVFWICRKNVGKMISPVRLPKADPESF